MDNVFEFKTNDTSRMISVFYGDYRVIPADAAIILYNPVDLQAEREDTNSRLMYVAKRAFHDRLAGRLNIEVGEKTRCETINAPIYARFPCGFRSVIFALHKECFMLEDIICASLCEAHAQKYSSVIIPAPRLVRREGNPELTPGDWVSSMKYGLKKFFIDKPYTSLREVGIIFEGSDRRAEGLKSRLNGFLKTPQ